MTPREFIDFLDSVKTMKTNCRHNWTDGNRRESVADHSWRLALMPLLIAEEFPSVDMTKVTKMCLIHDLGEAVTGDIPCFVKSDGDRAAEREALDGLLDGLSETVRSEFDALFSEMWELKTPEARLFKALDCLEAVISHNEADINSWQPNEYELQFTYGRDKVGWHPWLAALKSEIDADTAKKISAGRGEI